MYDIIYSKTAVFVRPHVNEKPAFSKISSLKSVFEKMRFRWPFVIGLDHQHGSRFIVLEHQYGRRDVMWKRSIRLDGALVKQNNNSARASRFF